MPGGASAPFTEEDDWVMAAAGGVRDYQHMPEETLHELLARGAPEWESLRRSAPLQWARDRRRCVFDTPDVGNTPDALVGERADPVAETMRLDAIEAHAQYRAQARVWGRDHSRTDETFERYDSLLGRYYRLAERARMPKVL